MKTTTRFRPYFETAFLTPLVLAIAVFLSAPAHAESQDTIDLQVRLARAHASPGPVDGLMGKNTENAIKAFQRIHGLEPTGQMNEETEKKLEELGNEPTIIDYEITEADVEGPFLDEIPAKMIEMAKLDGLYYTSSLEHLAEKFHMDQDLVQSLNSGKNFDKAGTVITVTDLAGLSLDKPVERLEIDKIGHTVDAYDSSDKLVAVYPATIGSDDTPSPEGDHTITGIAENPTYTYDPKKLDFDGGSDKAFTIPPGPNNPVGIVWIALDAPGYGIHGSPAPAKIRRQQSHGCVRLTNWDALSLARALKQGMPVSFIPADGEDGTASKKASSE